MPEIVKSRMKLVDSSAIEERTLVDKFFLSSRQTIGTNRGQPDNLKSIEGRLLGKVPLSLRQSLRDSYDRLGNSIDVPLIKVLSSHSSIPLKLKIFKEGNN